VENMALIFGTALVIYLLWPKIQSCFLFQKQRDLPIRGLEEVVGRDKVDSTMLLYFYSPNCGPCRKMSPRIDKLCADGLHIQKINVLEHREFAVKAGVVGLPSVMLVQQGLLKRKILGSASERRLRHLLSSSEDVTQAA